MRNQTMAQLEDRLDGVTVITKYISEKFSDIFTFNANDMQLYKYKNMLNYAYISNDFKNAKMIAAKLRNKDLRVKCSANIISFQLFRLMKVARSFCEK